MPDELVYRSMAAPPPGDDPLEYVMCDATQDSYGDVIEPGGWDLRSFTRHAPALFNHQPDQMVGGWENVRVEKGRLIGRLKLAEAGTSPFTDYIRGLVRQGFLRAVSVGFRPLEKEQLERGYRFLKSELRECSLVAVPANPNALAIARSLGSYPVEFERKVFGVHAEKDLARPAVHGLKAKSLPVNGNPKMSNNSPLAAKIQKGQADLNAYRDQLSALSNLDELTDEQDVQFKELPTRIDGTLEQLAVWQSAERAMAVGLTPQSEDAVREREHRIAGPVEPRERRPFGVPKKKLEPIDYFFRIATCFALARATGSRRPEQEMLERYPNDEATGMVVKAASGPAITTQAGWAAELVQIGFADFLDLLYPGAIYPALASRGPKFTFGPNAGTIKIPSRSSTPTVAGAFVAEAAPIPVKKLGLTSITLTPYKMAVISMFSEELANRSTPQIEQILRDTMTEDTRVAIDTALIDATAVSTGVRPAGLRNGVSGLTPTASGTNTEKIIADMKQLLGAIYNVNGGRDVVLIMNPAQALGVNFAIASTGQLVFNGVADAAARFGVTVVQSTTCPAGMLIAVDAVDFASASGDTPRFRVSADAMVHDEDTTPLAIATGAQGSGVLATPSRSFFQTDVMGIRMIWDLTWQMRRTGMVSWMTGVTW